MKSWKRMSAKTILCLLPGLLITTPASAQFAEDALRFSLFNLPVGARALGMGNVSIGLADDYAGLFSNPAGLASVRSYEFSAGLSNSAYDNDVAFYGVSTQSSNRATNLNNLGLIYPIATKRGSLTFAFGYGRVASYTGSAVYEGFNPHSSIVEALTPNVNLNSMSASARRELLENNIPFQIYLADTIGGRLYPNVYDSVQQSGSVLEGGGMNNWSLGGAIDIAKDLALGFSVNILSGTYTYDRLYTESDLRDVYRYDPPFDFDQFRYQSTINSDISGYNLLIGLMYRKQGKFGIGMTVRTPTYYDVSEKYRDFGSSRFDNGDRYELDLPGATDYSIRTPLVLGAGASFHVGEWLILAGDAEYTDWTELEFTNDNPDLISENRVIRDILQATTNLRGGAELTLWRWDLKLRGGVVYNPSPYKGDPKDFNQLYYTAGLGLLVDYNVTINAGYATGTWKTFRDNYSIAGFPQASRTNESVNSSTFNVTLSYRF